jgi:CheY-like chemotaxis protein
MNLAVNARDAMPRGGRLVLSTRTCLLDAARLAPWPDVAPGEFVELQVADSGSGIAPDVLPRIFEPFFTTKPTGRGTGMGLSVVYGIVKQNGGHIEVESEPGRGTVFRLYFPRAQGRADEAAGAPDVVPPGAGEHVLLVEDEAGVRRALARLLQGGGYRVTEAPDAPAALALFETQSFDLVLTDVIMPGPSGVEMVHRMRQRRPDQRVVFCSGYTDDLVDRAALETGATRLLAKPVQRADLLRTVHAVLHGRTPDA